MPAILVPSVKMQDNLICLVFRVFPTKPYWKNFKKKVWCILKTKNKKNHSMYCYAYLANKQVIKLESIIAISDAQINLLSLIWKTCVSKSTAYIWESWFQTLCVVIFLKWLMTVRCLTLKISLGTCNFCLATIHFQKI